MNASTSSGDTLRRDGPAASSIRRFQSSRSARHGSAVQVTVEVVLLLAVLLLMSSSLVNRFAPA
jgi:hypothetical protein